MNIKIKIKIRYRKHKTKTILLKNVYLKSKIEKI